MNIHPLWFICLTIRSLLIYSIYKFRNLKYPFLILTSVIGLGFLYKSITGSNNETQINKVFWHSTRSTHAILFLLSSFCLFKNNYKMINILLCIDITFSVLYRIISQQ